MNNKQKFHKSLRLKHWDYTRGSYFITIITARRQHLFAQHNYHQHATQLWQNIPTHPHAQYTTLGLWIIMPDHLHAIIHLHPPHPANKANHPSHLIPKSLGAIVGNYKSLASRQINNLRRTWGTSIWQRGYYERIIRDEIALHNISQYIANNPRRWAEKRDNLDKLITHMNYHPD